MGYFIWVANNNKSNSIYNSTRNGNDSGITLTIPKDIPEANITSDDNFEIQIKLDQKYWESLGNKSQVSNSLTISKGIAQVGGLGNWCSIENFSNKGSATSTLIVQIDNHPFYKVVQTENGMNQTFNLERYVQMLNTTQCRFIEFSNNWGNPGAYYRDQIDIDRMNKDNENFVKILELKQQEIFSKIKVD